MGNISLTEVHDIPDDLAEFGEAFFTVIKQAKLRQLWEYHWSLSEETKSAPIASVGKQVIVEDRSSSWNPILLQDIVGTDSESPESDSLLAFGIDLCFPMGRMQRQ